VCAVVRNDICQNGGVYQVRYPFISQIHELSFMTDHQEGGSPTNTVPAPGRPEPD